MRAQMDEVAAALRTSYRVRLWKKLWKYLCKWATAAMRDGMVADLNIHIMFRDGAGFTLGLSDPQPRAPAHFATDDSEYPEARSVRATVAHLNKHAPEAVRTWDLAPGLTEYALEHWDDEGYWYKGEDEDNDEHKEAPV